MIGRRLTAEGLAANRSIQEKQADFEQMAELVDAKDNKVYILH